MALWRHGFPSQRFFATEMGVARSTTDNFFNGRPVDARIFIEISEKLGLDWQVIAYIEEDPFIKVKSSLPL